MQLIGQAIRHERFGKGVVTGCEADVLTVCFQGGDRKFIYPDAFARHLTLRDSAMQNKVLSLLNAREEKREAERQAVQETRERRHRLENLRVSPNSHAAFRLTQAQAEELETCWTVSTGTYLTGYSKGEPRVPDRMKPNSLCLMTCRKDGEPEGGRRILGAFMVEEDFFGADCRDGVIHAHPRYRLLLAPEERPLLWPYLTQEPGKQRWGGMDMKYVPAGAAEQILFDLWGAAGADETVGAFYRYFCKLNHLSPRERAKADADS